MERLPKVLNRGDIANNLEKRVILCGSPTNFPLQHPMGHFMNYPHTAYIDLEDGTQIPVYLKTKISQKIPGRNAKMCYSRYRRLTNQVKEMWT